ncbi:hypothetical protein RSJ21_19680 (plasmid) [Clostridium botulinum]|uniref:Uncharacterized protein n=3 Tax=Clostridium botulinum TaxID=1491 RepID=A0A846I969_CLOBO|nr:Blp family class II bacteriocin [Clostridium botulinum]EKN38094.1 hypothetical protein CFSAN001627_24446 [Clostridium botulinum CFSAN001627]EPS51659.1 hypothetical protein CFSAN002367_05813 [Clostridium botulinum CFSAN002367]APQ74991.1 bacteriocin class II with double-glycine leader peptide family protein [Clostridium botulinum]AUN01021.1 hypothetical protein RSJ13_18775 [Clostridium botulinum]AUN12730.1 hypothetical protein RSJ6_19990 [Clostridium botulinum]
MENINLNELQEINGGMTAGGVLYATGKGAVTGALTGAGFGGAPGAILGAVYGAPFGALDYVISDRLK